MADESIYRLLYWILLAGVLVMRVYFAIRVRQAGERVMPDRQAVQREGRVMFVIRAVLFFLLMGWLVIYAVSPFWLEALAIPIPGWARWGGFILGLGSLGFWTWTQIALGKQWSAQLQLTEDHHLVTNGPYRRIRHPLYAAMMGYGAGIALVTANWVFLGLTVFVIAGSVARVPKEERMMVEEFGDEYTRYMQHTGRFLPK